MRWEKHVADLISAVPGLAILRDYDLAQLWRDLAAGAVLAAFSIPVGMGYAQAAGLPAINGLYATIVPLLAYAIFGPSRLLVVGPDSSLTPVIAAVVVTVADGAPEAAVQVGAALAIGTGLMTLMTGLFRLGFVTELLSRPARSGYLAGVALALVISQCPQILGVTVARDDLASLVRATMGAVALGQANATSSALGVTALVTMLAFRRWAPRLPAPLIVVIIGIGAVAICGFEVHAIGVLPGGFPAFGLPIVPVAALPEIVAATLAIAVIATADTSVLSQSLALRRREEVDPDRELRALGLANVATGFFQGFPISGSASRTPVLIAAGAGSQVASLIAAGAVTGMLVFAPGVLRNLPQAVLSAIIISAAIQLVDLHELVRLWRMRRVEFVLWVVAFLGVASLGVLAGVGVAIVLSLADFVRRAWRPHDAVLVRVDTLKGYHDAERHPEGRTIPGLLLYRFDAPLFFANASYFRREVRAHLAAAVERVRWVVVAADPITDVDTTAADMLSQLREELLQQGVTLAFAGMKGPVKDRLRVYGLYEPIGGDRFFPTIGTAVDAYVAEAAVDWVDWEERGRQSRNPEPL